MKPELCILFYYAFNIASLAIPFAFIAFTIQRFCSLLYHTKHFFKTKRWIALCIASQWFVEFIISLPFVFRTSRKCTNEFWMTVYTLVTAVVVPSLVNFILNSMIFGHVRSSTRRVQPQNPSAWASRITTQQENRQQAPKISRREISLLRQMIFMFAMFIGGWSPVFIVDIFLQLVNVNTMITAVTILFGEYVSNRALVYDENIRPNITRRNMAKPRWATVRRLSSVKEILT
ncbi:unnamed protein product [Adineta ricciae]|uniref:G-protein coupled receptors family 1 profile domain-containing protein n=1 Tax=Adineta ricciae TaxID=249248 RepID=A0A813WKF3_ADIRI|nr:unnamed protein product [Adineta ricciae]